MSAEQFEVCRHDVLRDRCVPCLREDRDHWAGETRTRGVERDRLTRELSAEREAHAASQRECGMKEAALQAAHDLRMEVNRDLVAANERARAAEAERDRLLGERTVVCDGYRVGEDGGET